MSLFITSALAEETAEAVQATVSPVIEKLTEVPAAVWVALAALVGLAVVLFVVSRQSRRWSSRMIAFGALAIALSFVLSCIRLYKMPTHGSVTPGSMLPLMLFAAVYGVGPGMLAGTVYGLLQFFQDPWVYNAPEFILDWILAFAALGLAGLAKGHSDKWLFISVPIAVIGRAVCAIAAGMIIVADAAPGDLQLGWFDGSTIQFTSKLGYSAAYNGIYLVPELLICLLIALLIGPRVLREIRKLSQSRR